MLYLALLMTIARGAFAAGSCAAPPRPHAADRRENFFEIRRRAEERERAREKGRGEIAGREVERQRRLEEARQVYIHSRRPKPDDSAGDQAWQATLTERRRQPEDARECYVTRRDRAAAQSSRDVPADVEYGLDE